MSDALSKKTSAFPGPDHPLSVAEIVSAIDANPEHIESCDEASNPHGSGRTMDQYIWVWPIHASISNDGQSVRGAGHEGEDHYFGIFGSWRIKRAIARWRRKVGVPGVPGHYSFDAEVRRLMKEEERGRA